MNTLTKIWSKLATLRPAVYGGLYFVAMPVFALVFYMIQGFQSVSLSLSDALYFSVVTITTLGYGDIQPKEALTRLLAASEAAFGVLMIGLFLSALSHSRSMEQADQEAKNWLTTKGTTLKKQSKSTRNFCNRCVIGSLLFLIF